MSVSWSHSYLFPVEPEDNRLPLHRQRRDLSVQSLLDLVSGLNQGTWTTVWRVMSQSCPRDLTLSVSKYGDPFSQVFSFRPPLRDRLLFVSQGEVLDLFESEVVPLCTQTEFGCRRLHPCTKGRSPVDLRRTSRNTKTGEVECLTSRPVLGIVRPCISFEIYVIQ